MPRVETTATVESFIVRDNHRDYATVFLRYRSEESGERVNYSGTLCVHSAYGTFGHFWSQCGEPFKQFLCDLDKHYLLGKISRLETDHDESEKRLRDRVKQARKDRRLTADEARSMIDDIEEAFGEYPAREAAFSLYNEGKLAKAVSDWTDVFASNFPVAHRQFVDRLWPEIVSAMNVPEPAIAGP